MTGAIRSECPGCGAQLRSRKPAGTVCDPCQRRGLPALGLPPGFWDAPRLQAALAQYEFGYVFRAVRRQLQCSQGQLGQILDMDQGWISDVERGRRPLVDVRVVSRVATRCGIPPVALGFGATTLGGGGSVPTVKGGNVMDRRDFVASVAGLALGMSSTIDMDRLTALLQPHVEQAGTSRIGVADVEIIEQITQAFRSQEFQCGSGPSCDGAIAQLRAALPMLQGDVPGALAPRLQLAVANLATQAGWMSYDSLRHETARRLWMIALDLAKATSDPRGADLSVYVLSDMALQSLHLKRPDEAHHITRIAEAAATGAALSATTRSLFHNIASQAFAACGEADACARAQDGAVAALDAPDTEPAPPWTAYVRRVGNISGGQGAALVTLAMSGESERPAEQAIPLLENALGGFGPSYARLGATYLPRLSSAYALAGHVEEAVTTGHQAVDAIEALSSPLVRDRLRTLNTTLGSVSHGPGVADLRHRLDRTLAAA